MTTDSLSETQPLTEGSAWPTGRNWALILRHRKKTNCESIDGLLTRKAASLSQDVGIKLPRKKPLMPIRRVKKSAKEQASKLVVARNRKFGNHLGHSELTEELTKAWACVMLPPVQSVPSQEEAADRRAYYPPPLAETAAANMTVNCLVYHLHMRDITVYVAKTADCFGVRGEGESQSLALQSLTSELEGRVLDGIGGLYNGRSSHAFQLDFFVSIVEDWAANGVSVLNVSCHTVVMFADNSCPKIVRRLKFSNV